MEGKIALLMEHGMERMSVIAISGEGGMSKRTAVLSMACSHAERLKKIITAQKWAQIKPIIIPRRKARHTKMSQPTTIRSNKIKWNYLVHTLQINPAGRRSRATCGAGRSFRREKGILRENVWEKGPAGKQMSSTAGCEIQSQVPSLAVVREKITELPNELTADIDKCDSLVSNAHGSETLSLCD